jgi:hypothetical protein
LQNCNHAFDHLVSRRARRKGNDLLRIVAPHPVRLFSLAGDAESAVVLIDVPKQHAAFECGPGFDSGIFQQHGRRYFAMSQYRHDRIAARDRCAQCLPNFLGV